MKTTKKLISLLLGIILIGSLFTITVSAAGNTMATATSISIGTTYNGSITDNNTVDYYKFTISSSGRVNIRLTAYIYKTHYYLYNSDGNVLWSSTYQQWNGTTGEYNLDVNLDLTSGTYYFSVQKYNGTGNYNFKLSFTSANETFKETGSGNNNTIKTAASINFNTVYYGQLATNDNTDIYKFTISSSGRINIRLTAFIYKTHYYLYNEDGNTLWSSTYQQWNGTTGEYNMDVNIDLTAGTYYLSVQKYDGTGNYNFKLLFISANESFKETGNGNNNSVQSSSLIDIGSTYYGQLAINDNNDIYKFTISTSGRINIRLTAHIYKTHYYLYDSNGNTVWSSTYQQWNSTIGEYNMDVNIDLTSGTYYFATQQYDGTGNYNFKISFISANETFKETGYGNNNSIKEAVSVNNGTKYYGQLAINDNSDIYRFTVSKSGEVNIRLTAYIYKTHYYLYNTDGNTIWSKTYQQWNGTTCEYKMDTNVELTAGTYYFAVQKYDGTGNYNFSIGGSSSADTVNPSASISSTNNVAASQTATLSMSDNVGLAGYYWGTSSSYSSNTYTSVSGTSYSTTKSISSSGTYYLTAKDTSGNISSTVSKTFYKTTLNGNNGSVSPSSVITMSGNSFALPTPTRSGYTCLGWATSSSATSASYSCGSSYKPTSNTTLYAVWKENTSTKYEIRYYYDSKSTQWNSGEYVTPGNTIKLPKITYNYKITYNANNGWGAPSTETFSFVCKGWSTTKNATFAQYGCMQEYTPSGNVNFYGVWDETAGTISSVKPTRNGYTFLGWSTSSTATTATYKSGSKIILSGSVTLYAVWKSNSTPSAQVYGVELEDSYTINYKDELQLNPQIKCDTGAKYTVEYSSTSKKIYVDDDGVLHGDIKGSATVTVKVTDSYGNIYTDTAKVTVKYTVIQWIIVIVLFGWIWY